MKAETRMHILNRALAVLAMLALVAFAGSARGVAAEKVFTIPVVVPLTGFGAEYGNGDRIAIEVAVAQINTTGGVDGYKLATQYYDDASDPTQDATILHGLVKNSLIVIGPGLSGSCKAAFPIANAEKMPIIGILSDASITADARPWTFNIHPSAQLFSKGAADKFLKLTKAKKFVAIVDKTTTAPSVQMQQMLEALKSDGAEIVQTIEVSQTQATYTAEADKAKSLDPDALVISAYPDANAAITKAMRAAGIAKPILFTATSLTPDAIKIGGAAMTNGWATVPSWYGIGTPRKLAFDHAFAAASKGTPEVVTAPYFYDAVYVLADALKSTHALSSNASLEQKREALRVAIEKGYFKGTMGDFSFRPDGNRPGIGQWVQIRDGKIAAGE